MTGSERVVGICGAGAMGSALGRRLVDGGVRVVTTSRSSSVATRERIESAGMQDVGTVERLVAESDVLMSVMGSTPALAFAGQVTRALEAQPRDGLVFAECNLISPPDVLAIARNLEALGARVVDAGIVGPPPSAAGSPCIYLSGAHAGELAFLSEHGLTVVQVGAEIGAASALKVCSAGVWQGCLALATEVWTTAHRYGLADRLESDLQEHQPPIYEWLLPALAEAVPRAHRWVDDMAVIGRTMADVGASDRYHLAARDLYAAMEDIPAAARSPQDVVRELAARLPSP